MFKNGQRCELLRMIVCLIVCLCLFNCSKLYAKETISSGAAGGDPNHISCNGTKFEFRDVAGSNAAAKPIPWTSAKREVVTKLATATCKAWPELAAAAAAGDPIVLYEMAQDAEHPLEMALTTDRGIFISSAFFNLKEPQQRHAFMHELVHASDFDQRIAYSPEWVKFAEPIISRIRCTQTLTENRAEYEHQIQQQQLWPSLLGCENLREALAEFLTCGKLKDSAFVYSDSAAQKWQLFAARIAKNAPTRNETLRSYRKGCRLIDEHKEQAAIDQFKRLDSMQPNSVAVLTRICGCYDRLKNSPERKNWTNKALALADAVAIPDTENEALYLHRCRTADLYSDRNFNGARALCMHLLPFNTSDSDQQNLLDTVVHADLLMTDYGSAAVDKLAGSKQQTKFDSLLASGADEQYVLTALSEHGQKAGRKALANFMRARYLEYLAESTDTSKAQAKHFEQALACLNELVPVNQELRTQYNIKKAIFYLKVGQVDKASETYQLLKTVNPPLIECDAIAVGLAQESGNKRKARQLYEAFAAKYEAQPPR